jgi:hypothetical protein
MLLNNYSLCTMHKSSVNIGFAENIMTILRILCYNGSLVTWTVVSLTTAKLKALIFSMSGFALYYTANMFILMIPYDFCLFHAQFCYIIIYIWKIKSCVHIADRCAPWEILHCCAEPCFVGAAILRGSCLSLIPRRDKRTLLLFWSVPCGGLVWFWCLNAHFSIGSRFW